MEARALRRRGWSLSATAGHLGRDRKTVRAYLRGDQEAGVRHFVAPDRLVPFVPYLRARFADNAHIWATALFDEVVPPGYEGSHPSFVRQLRQADLRPHCEARAGVKGREYSEIRRAPWGGMANILLGTLPFSGRMRGPWRIILTKPTSSKVSTECCAGSGARPESGELTGWRP